MSGLPTPVGRALRSAADDVTLERVWRRVAETRSGDALRLERPNRLRWAFAVSGLAAATAMAIVVVGLARRPQLDAGPVRLANGQDIEASLLQTQATARTVALSDGSSLEIAANTAMDLVENDGRHFSLLLVRGKTTFEVRPGGPRRWSIEAGLASVEVVGTHFTVARTRERVHVDVERGTVLVRSDFLPERVRKLTVAQAVDIDDPAAVKPAPAPEPPKSAAAPEPAEPTRPTPHSAVHHHPATQLAQNAPSVPPPSEVPAAPSEAPAPPPVEWKTLAKEGAYKSAYNSLGSTGVVKETARAPRAEDLMALADISRYSGHPASAVSPLEEVVLHHREEPALAAEAAVTLGNIQLNKLSDPRRAAEAYAQAIELHPPRGLLEVAYAGLVESRAKAGDETGARAAAAEYVKQFPDGQYQKDMDAWLPRK